MILLSDADGQTVDISNLAQITTDLRTFLLLEIPVSLVVCSGQMLPILSKHIKRTMCTKGPADTPIITSVTSNMVNCPQILPININKTSD